MTRPSFSKTDDEHQVVFSEIYAPGIPDSQGDFMTADQIRAMAYRFIASGNLGQVDRDHDNQAFGASVVESFIARDDDKVFIPGSWVVGVHIPDPVQWQQVKNGTYNGFSLDGEGDRVDRALTLRIPDNIKGQTSVDRGHSHTFSVSYDSEGKFLGGGTNIVDGHSHSISRGTVTDEADGHTHRFSHVEQIDGQADR